MPKQPHRGWTSCPVDLSQFPEEVRRTFKGMSILNNGSILVAYNEPICIINIMLDAEYGLFHSPIYLNAGQRFSIEARPLNEGEIQ